MLRIQWSELVGPTSSLHLVVASLPVVSADDRTTSMLPHQMLVRRLLKTLPLTGRYAVTICRAHGGQEILCAFEKAVDAQHAARAFDATLGGTAGGLDLRVHISPRRDGRGAGPEGCRAWRTAPAAQSPTSRMTSHDELDANCRRTLRYTSLAVRANGSSQRSEGAARRDTASGGLFPPRAATGRPECRYIAPNNMEVS